MKKLIAAAALVTAMFAAGGGVASAHHTTVSCADKETSTWSIVNSENRDMTFTTNQGHSGEIGPKGTAFVVFNGTALTVYGTWDNGVTQTNGGQGDCARTLQPSVEITHAAQCGAFSVTVTNTDIPDWWYGVRIAVDGTQVGTAIKQGPGSNTFNGTLEEDQGDGQVTVTYWVYASTEQDLLPADLKPVAPDGSGAVRSFVVDTDCVENPPETTAPPETSPPTTVNPCEDDDPTTGICGPATVDTQPEPECTTGVTNELGGCEPVGNEPDPTTGAPVTTDPPTLPNTGVETWHMALVAGIVTALGFGAQKAARR